jgi:hypothetical protein
MDPHSRVYVDNPRSLHNMNYRDSYKVQDCDRDKDIDSSGTGIMFFAHAVGSIHLRYW